HTLNYFGHTFYYFGYTFNVFDQNFNCLSTQPFLTQPTIVFLNTSQLQTRSVTPVEPASPTIRSLRSPLRTRRSRSKSGSGKRMESLSDFDFAERSRRLENGKFYSVTI